MAGNVSEWCQDWFMADYYKLREATRNPQGPGEHDADNVAMGNQNGKTRVLRGAEWFSDQFSCLATTRHQSFPANRFCASCGFRVVVLPPRRPKAEAQPETRNARPETVPSKSAWDDAYVATAATGEKIPHPLSRKTYKQALPDGTTVDCPEGMAYVPAGQFLMGADGDPWAGPAHEVKVPAFFIDKYEVTNAQYAQFCRQTNRKMPRYIAWNNDRIPTGREAHPVTCVTWEDAKAYCDWCGKRLPTEAEWEKAASWDPAKRQRYTYPWGNDDPNPAEPMTNCAQLWGFKTGSDVDAWRHSFEQSDKGKELNALGGPTLPVGSYPRNASPSGCYDMAGNVWEWVSDWFDRYPGNTAMPASSAALCGQKARVIRGGAWGLYDTADNCSNRVGYLTNAVSTGAGFRSAADCPWKPKP
jgi:formylglycine-generating enzyme required for sulfatase activity